MKNKSLYSADSICSAMVQDKTGKCHQAFEIKMKSIISQTSVKCKMLAKAPMDLFSQDSGTLSKILIKDLDTSHFKQRFSIIQAVIQH